MRVVRSVRVLLFASALLGPGGPAAGAVRVEARLSRSNLPLGESTTLEITVGGALTGVKSPEMGLPPEVAVLGSSRAESVQFVNGRMAREVVFRYELGAREAGRYTVGPVKVTVGNDTYLSGALVLNVSAAAARTAPAGRAPAVLRTEVRPQRAWVGQEVMLAVHLLQRATLAQDPEYAPPATPGFWADRPSQPESYYADAGGERVLVTETRTRLYPLAAGALTVGPASAVVVLRDERASGPFADPFDRLAGRVAARPIELKSESVHVQVMPLPTPAPVGFIGAVGGFQARWWSDRRRTALDVPFTVTLELRGAGNLPLVRTPEWSPAECEIYASQSEDSLARPGTHEPGRKRYTWTLLARRTGKLTVAPPPVATFDPDAGRYRVLELPTIELEVTRPVLAQPGAAEHYPAVLLAHPASPGRRGPAPWAWAVAGLFLGVALRLFARARAPDAGAPERARAAEWRRALVAPSRGPDWWRAAEEAVGWLAERGRHVHHLRQQIQSARYGGETGQEEDVRKRLLAHLAPAAPAAPARWPLRWLAVGVLAAAAALAWGFGPRGADARRVAQARQAEDWARRGEWERARRGWKESWRATRDPGLAARLAWSWAQSGDAGPATLWVMRGLAENPRDPALRWVAQRARETGGLVGDLGVTWWPTPLEAAIGALLVGLCGALLWERRRGAAAAVALLAAAAALSPPARVRLHSRAERVVVVRETLLAPAEGEPLQLEPGQVLDVKGAAGAELDVRAGRDVEGRVPRSAVVWVAPPPASRDRAR